MRPCTASHDLLQPSTARAYRFHAVDARPRAQADDVAGPGPDPLVRCGHRHLLRRLVRGGG
eukprot:4906122-Pleurochrysis_carterae.AAC.1